MWMLVIAKKWKQPKYPSVSDRTKKTCYMCRMDIEIKSCHSSNLERTEEISQTQNKDCTNLILCKVIFTDLIKIGCRIKVINRLGDSNGGDTRQEKEILLLNSVTAANVLYCMYILESGKKDFYIFTQKKEMVNI